MACAPRVAGRALIKVYRLTLSPLIGFHCRHLPTCSEYADAALARFGLWAGVWMTFARLCRCHPFGTSGLDFVPARLPPGARWYLPWRYGRWRGTNDRTDAEQPAASGPTDMPPNLRCHPWKPSQSRDGL
ncbi:MAG: membrane protein insertion efficiency factor YidD [Xanthobacteraceae bacterium]